MEVLDTDVIVIGAGVIGLASARALARAGREVILLEAEPMIAVHTSSRNSEVIHAGIYYAEGSQKAHLCVEGRRQLYAYLTSTAWLIIAAENWSSHTPKRQVAWNLSLSARSKMELKDLA